MMADLPRSFSSLSEPWGTNVFLVEPFALVDALRLDDVRLYGLKCYIIETTQCRGKDGRCGREPYL